MPERLRLGGAGRNKHGMYLTRGGANPNNLIGGNVWDDIADGIGSVTRFVPVVNDVYKATRKLVGGAPRIAKPNSLLEANQKYHTAVKTDREMFDKVTEKVEKAVKAINDLEKAGFDKATGSQIKKAIYSKDAERFKYLEDNGLKTLSEGLDDAQKTYIRLQSALADAPEDQRRPALLALAQLLEINPAAVPVDGEGRIPSKIQKALNEKIVQVYNSQPTEAAKLQFLRNVIDVGAQYLDKGIQRLYKLKKDSTSSVEGYKDLIDEGRDTYLFRDPNLGQLYTANLGTARKPHDVAYYIKDGKYYSGESFNEYKPEGPIAKKLGALPARTRLGYPDGVGAPSAYNTGLSFGQAAAAAAGGDDDDDDDGAQVGNGWGR